ncbi:antibiotic biosynthesis monooxygenase [Micromonospora echinospora]|uniref:Antibiotic biosynthesis monooxygenase n=1 Tax=Micromonospora echinospora TaxID=1877 RepID=A0A1C5AA82_MICEC|nr:antibiotic biosynthesis monooxygenase [Micromonospora echinospora]SCF42059.1 Antibiotic biosynthesis monooxygenase [Micromonospora echinospora]
MSTAGRARVMVWHRAPADDADAVAKAYDQISRHLEGTPGLIGNELLRSTTDPHRMVVLSEWESLAAFRVWEEGVSHRPSTSPLRQYQDREQENFFEVFEVSAAF